MLFVLGVWFLLQQATLPDMQMFWWHIVILPTLFIPKRYRLQRIVHYFIFMCFALSSGFFYAAWIAQH
jgi:hypothetical protein